MLRCVHLDTTSRCFMSTTMTIRLDDELKEQLDRLAAATQRSKSFLASEAIREFIELNEWQVREIQQALKKRPMRANLPVMVRQSKHVKSLPHVPMSHPFVERLIGSVRRGCWIRPCSGPHQTWRTSSRITGAITASIGAILVVMARLQ